MPREPVGATVYVVGKTLATINAQPSACQETGPLYVRLSGRVDRDGALGLQPVPFVEVDLVQEGKVVARSATDSGGVFGFTQMLSPGLYDILLVSDRFAGQARVLLDGRRPDVQLLAHAR
jgi:hypothetical protein